MLAAPGSDRGCEFGRAKRLLLADTVGGTGVVEALILVAVAAMVLGAVQLLGDRVGAKLECQGQAIAGIGSGGGSLPCGSSALIGDDPLGRPSPGGDPVGGDDPVGGGGPGGGGPGSSDGLGAEPPTAPAEPPCDRTCVGEREFQRGLERMRRGLSVVGVAGSDGFEGEDGVLGNVFRPFGLAQMFGRIHDMQAELAEFENEATGGSDWYFTAVNALTALHGMTVAIATGSAALGAAYAKQIWGWFGYDTTGMPPGTDTMVIGSNTGPPGVDRLGQPGHGVAAAPAPAQ